MYHHLKWCDKSEDHDILLSLPCALLVDFICPSDCDLCLVRVCVCVSYSNVTLNILRLLQQNKLSIVEFQVLIALIYITDVLSYIYWNTKIRSPQNI
jgi:hypothetical protein